MYKTFGNRRNPIINNRDLPTPTQKVIVDGVNGALAKAQAIYARTGRASDRLVVELLQEKLAVVSVGYVETEEKVAA